MSGRKGRDREHKSRRHLEREGYEVVRSAGSKGVFDLIAFNETEILLVQVKANGWAGPVERTRMAFFSAPPNVRRIVHRWDDYAKAPKVREIAAGDLGLVEPAP